MSMIENLKESHVLFVDDEDDILNVMKRMMIDEIDHIFTANNVELALEIFNNNQIDVVVLDYKMPQKNGLTLLKEFKALKPKTVFIMITGYGDKEIIQNALRDDIFDVIDKPFDNKYIKKTILNAIQKSHYQAVVADVVDTFISNYARLEFQDFSKLNYEDREKIIQTVLELTRNRIKNKIK
ncbi:MAG: response regulator [Oligoflexia bacterium]|nr:response regulator [Oligoflexia bacterium]